MFYYVYVLESSIRNYRYVGLSHEPDVRLRCHNTGQNKKTKAYAPFKRIVVERFPSRQEARKREQYLKSGIDRSFLDCLQKASQEYFGYMPGWRNW